EAAPILGRMMTRLAVPAPDGARSTAAIAADRQTTMPADWQRLGRPFGERLLELALERARELSSTTSTTAVNGDLHHEQVLAGRREEWLCVDPVLLRGDREYDLARILWYRLDELSGTGIERCFDLVVGAAELDHERARSWVLLRSVDYWLWGLDHGLTEDPVRCARLVQHFR
ncbi:MAG: aminoglycoside phosphotransferase family protein, partial [Propionibacteriaceae bacterium]